MPLPVATRFLTCTLVMLSIVLPLRAQTTFDHAKLDAHIDIKLVDASMTDAVTTLAKLADIRVAAPAAPEKGLSANLRDQPVKVVLDMIGRAAGLSWYIESGVVVFRKPTRKPDDEKPEKPLGKLSPEDGMTEMVRTLDGPKMFRLSRGIPLSYGELTPRQQEILKAVLSPPNVGITEGGTVVKTLPSADRISLSFYTMPYLMVPRAGSNEPIPLRLDSTPYVLLKKAGAE